MPALFAIFAQRILIWDGGFDLQPTIEIEASLDVNDGMTVGVFGPRARVTEGDAREMVQRVTSILLNGLA